MERTLPVYGSILGVIANARGCLYYIHQNRYTRADGVPVRLATVPSKDARAISSFLECRSTS